MSRILLQNDEQEGPEGGNYLTLERAEQLLWRFRKVGGTGASLNVSTAGAAGEGGAETAAKEGAREARLPGPRPAAQISLLGRLEQDS
jgi:hypothetical protein